MASKSAWISLSSHGDVGLESGSREDHIRDGNIADVRFVRLGTDDRELGVRKMLDAMLDIAVEATWLYEVKHGKDLEALSTRELERSATRFTPTRARDRIQASRTDLERFSRMITNRCGDM
ncbi:hypothetical protein EVAR_62812_1 [Eumeta japonica]|uniref:Uncharacterized protein n=1 Tax=Eumeta variegata TaxID=151549 RepID=A0A4C1ZPQ6_EUMVA|nr:hypothetical protein EVAR_62812_1 [Eumeta japonica]